jgi:arylsulfatase A-like enzyme
MKFRSIVFLLLIPVLFMACGIGSSGKNPGRPNVIVFLTDDQGWGDLSYHGNPLAQTPHIDRFAAESVEFERFYVSSVCSPTRASVMTGRWNFRTGVTNVVRDDSRMNLDEVTVAEILRQAGYATAMYGKWHLGGEEEYSPHNRGFEDAIYPAGHGQFGGYNNPSAKHNGKSVKFEGYSMDLWTDHAIAFMKKSKAEDRPFFLYLPTNLVHSPMDPKPGYDKPYLDKGLKEPVSAIYGMQQSIDENFGCLMKALEEGGLADNTLTIYFSDNGPQGHFSEGRHMAGLRGIKGIMYDNGIRVPCFFRWPVAGLEAGRRIQKIAAHVDLLPTLLEACQVEVPERLRLDGKSLIPVLTSKAAEAVWPDRYLFFQWDALSIPQKNLCFAVVGQRYKLVQANGNAREVMCQQYEDVCQWNERRYEPIRSKTPKYELFDLVNDPGEDNDLAKKHPELVRDMRKEYESWFDDVIKGVKKEGKKL